MPRSGSMVLLLMASLLPVATSALAADPTLEIPITIEKNRFQPDEIKVKAGVPFVLVVTNKDATAEEFESKDVPVDSYGVGSSLIRGSNDFTADVVVTDGKSTAKAGRRYRPNPRLERVD